MKNKLKSSADVPAGTDPDPAIEGLKRLLNERRQKMQTQQQQKQEEMAEETE